MVNLFVRGASDDIIGTVIMLIMFNSILEFNFIRGTHGAGNLRFPCDPSLKLRGTKVPLKPFL